MGIRFRTGGSAYRADQGEYRTRTVFVRVSATTVRPPVPDSPSGPIVRRLLNRLRRRLAAPWPDGAPSPWAPPGRSERLASAVCNICRWTGDAFDGPNHSEFSVCPRCGSISRDRFLFWCYVQRTGEQLGATVLETSPRLGEDYRSVVGRWFDYTASDFDERAHKGSVQIDLQAIDLPDDSVDVLLTPHVLEHVPETDRALDEIKRVLAPGGRMYLQVPVLQGATAPPVEPEFHGDDTPVFWRFGPDLTARLRDHGFTTNLLCTQQWLDHVRSGATSWPTETSAEFDVDSLLAGTIEQDLVPVATAADADQRGFLPAYMFLTWECIAPG